MSSNAMQLLQLIVNSMWTLFTSWKLPGLGFTPAQFIAFLLLFPLVLDFVSSILGGVSSNFEKISTSIGNSHFYQEHQKKVEQLRYDSQVRGHKGW